MTIAFGPELVGQTEKTLSALLLLTLEGTGLTEPQWVTLRIAEIGGEGDLPARVFDRARFDDADALVGGLTDRGLLSDGALTDAGRALISGVRERTTARTGGLWDDLPRDDVAAAERVLNELLERARGVLAKG
ncbi:MAG TPA: MarR family transcriptional regulator [Nocardioides sp.]|nr:MarR family transcriptional regulator [Nocardioides sp.]